MDKKVLAILFLLIALALLAAWLKGAFSAPMQVGVRVKVGDHEYEVEVADTIPVKAQGLSDRDGLAAGHGMFFVFNPAQSEAFWMHGMRFAIDIIWIRDGKVVDFVENAPPPTNSLNPAIFSSPGPIDRVLEVPAGTVAADGLKIGDTVTVSGYTK